MNKQTELDKSFYKTMLIIALPVIIQHIISIGLNMVDTVMVSTLGENAISAVGLANRFYFVFSVICFGIYSGTSIFIAQYWGAGDTTNIKKVFGINLVIGTLLSILFSTILFFFPDKILRVFINDAVVIDLGTKFLKIVSFSYFFTSISFAFSFSSRAIHRLKLPTIVTGIALLINTFLNYALINGKFGFPALGVQGSALATVIARTFELLTMIIFIYKDKSHPLAGSFKEFVSWDLALFKSVIKTSMPVMLSETAWSVGTSVYFIAYGYLGSYAIAVVQISTTISDFFQSLFFGLGSACAVMIGNEIGRNKVENAFYCSKKFIKITLILSIVLTILLLLFKGTIIKFFNLEPDTVYYLDKALIVFAIYFTPKMFSYMFIIGILRSGGDTKFCMVIDIVTIWFIGIPLAFIAVLIFKLPIHLVMAVAFSEEVMKLFVLIKRYESKKWINNLIMKYDEGI